MSITRHNVQLQYTKKEVRALLNAAYQAHVDKGGRYTTHNAEIRVQPKDTASDVASASPLCTLYFDWTTQRLTTIECAEHHSRQEMLLELGVIEALAWGKTKHGNLP